MMRIPLFVDNAVTQVDAKRRHARFGFVSILIAVVNISIVIYFGWLLTQWTMTHPEEVKELASGRVMRLPDSVMIKIIILVVLEVAGLLTGILGLFEKSKRKVLPIIGILLNGLFFFLTGLKLHWKVW
jgi:hypothetical protein